jgi:hypothetical protein
LPVDARHDHTVHGVNFPALEQSRPNLTPAKTCNRRPLLIRDCDTDRIGHHLHYAATTKSVKYTLAKWGRWRRMMAMTTSEFTAVLRDQIGSAAGGR